jgi:alkanesulfonate monooxygenase SsuD/methylene tetrahydromethanopterin reductase-like flavin-dependent oxidoreductase (luciferase family)
MVSIGRIICGSPDTVADTLSHWAQEAQCSRMLMVLQHGDMPEWKAVKNMHMFAKEVIPRVRARASVPQPEAVLAGVK